MSADRHLEAAGYSIASNILVQILSKLVTFGFKAISLKYLHSSSILGIVYVRLALLYTTLQFLSREPFRRACLSTTSKADTKMMPLVINTIWLGIVLSIVLSIPLSMIWFTYAPSSQDLTGTNESDYQLAVLITCLSVVLEMINEPAFVYTQAKMMMDHNPKVEVFTLSIRNFLIAMVTIMDNNVDSTGNASFILSKISCCILSSSIFQIIYSYHRLLSETRKSLKTFFPSKIFHKTGSKAIFTHFHDESLRLSLSFMRQTSLKQLLTESERYVMTFFGVISLSEQGIYDVVNNLGSMAARMIFKPIEDGGYTLFSQTVKRTEAMDIRQFFRVQENLFFLIRSMTLLGLVILVFGYNFVPLIVLYGGDKLNNPTAFNLMKWQLFYTPLLAVNGVTECFTAAIMDSRQMKNYNYCLIISSLVFLITLLMSHPIIGSACFIFANCFNMIIRIVYGFSVIGTFFERYGYTFDAHEMAPSLTTSISLTGVFLFLSMSQSYLLDLTQPVSTMFGLMLGGWCIVFMVHVVICHEFPLLDFISKLFKQKHRRD